MPTANWSCWVLLALLLSGLTGCRSESLSGMSVAVETPMSMETPAVATSGWPEATPIPTNPAVISTLPPADMPSFAPVNPAEIAQSVTPAPAATAENSQETADVQNAPHPTFTPPALPLTSADEHYWFRRPVAEGGVVWTDKVYPYGSTRGGTLRTHHGVEFYVPSGTEILAVASGVVRVASDDSQVVYGPHNNFYGNLVVIEHDVQLNGQPVYTLYAHLSLVLVNEGERVASQQTIGISGATGVADGPHMHFEVRVGQNQYDSTRNPLLWLYPFPDRGVVAGRITWPDGRLVYEAPVSLRRIDAASRYFATTTYADDGVNPDDFWQENFALDDVDAGYYEVIVVTGNKQYKTEVWVLPYRTSFVEIVLDAE